MKLSALRFPAAGLLGLGLWLATGLAWGDPIVEIEGGYWIPEFTARVKSTVAGTGTNIELDEDLGVDDENLPDARIKLNAGPLGSFRLGYTRVSLSGEKSLERDIVFDGRTFSTSTRVLTDFEADYLRLGWLWQVGLLDTVKLGPILEAKGIFGKTSLESTSPPAKETQNFALGLPTIGAALNYVPFDSVDFFAEASGLPAGNLGYFIDAEAGIKIIPMRFVSIVGGYRVFDIKLESGADSARLLFRGPFVALTVRF